MRRRAVGAARLRRERRHVSVCEYNVMSSDSSFARTRSTDASRQDGMGHDKHLESRDGTTTECMLWALSIHNSSWMASSTLTR